MSAPRPLELAGVTLAAAIALLLVGVAPLETPYWWDAAAVYVPGSQWVESHGFAAFPGVFPSLLHRGHTTLFYLLTAGVFRLFGSEPPIGHAVVLGFATATLALTYALGARLFGRPAGVAAALLLGVSPLFLTMSSQVLPEIPLAALTAASLYAFSRGAHGSAALLGVLVVLTKETGVSCPLAIAGALMLEAGWRHRRAPGSWRPLARPIAIAFVPVAALAAYFVWQRVAEGWWVLPYHAELFGLEHDYVRQGAGVFRSMLLADGRWLALLGAAAIGAARLRWMPETFAPDPAPLEAEQTGAPARWVVCVALVLVFLANQGFFTQMWFLERYALTAHPGLAVLLGGLLVPAAWASTRARTLTALGAAVVLATGAMATAGRAAGDDYASGETTFRYLRMVEAHRAIYAHLEAREVAPVVLTTWPMTDELRKPELGWVTRPYAAVGLSGYQDGSDTRAAGRPVEAVVTAQGLGAHDALRAEARRLGMERTDRVAVGTAVVELWELP